MAATDPATGISGQISFNVHPQLRIAGTMARGANLNIVQKRDDGACCGKVPAQKA
jgi:hypothetical protein